MGCGGKVKQLMSCAICSCTTARNKSAVCWASRVCYWTGEAAIEAGFNKFGVTERLIAPGPTVLSGLSPVHVRATPLLLFVMLVAVVGVLIVPVVELGGVLITIYYSFYELLL